MSMVLYRRQEPNFQLLDYECYGFEFEKLYPVSGTGRPSMNGAQLIARARHLRGRAVGDDVPVSGQERRTGNRRLRRQAMAAGATGGRAAGRAGQLGAVNAGSVSR